MIRKRKLIMTAIGAGLLGGILSACGINNNPKQLVIESPEESESESDSTTEMVALVDTESEAQEIAELYEIELLNFSNGVAVYTTDRDPYELIALGNEKGYPTLSINRELHLY